MMISKISGKISPDDAFFILDKLRREPNWDETSQNMLNQFLVAYKLTHSDILSECKQELNKAVDAQLDHERRQHEDSLRRNREADERKQMLAFEGLRTRGDYTGFIDKILRAPRKDAVEWTAEENAMAKRLTSGFGGKMEIYLEGWFFPRYKFRHIDEAKKVRDTFATMQPELIPGYARHGSISEARSEIFGLTRGRHLGHHTNF